MVDSRDRTLTKEQEIFKESFRYNLTVRAMEVEDFDRGFDELVPYQALERRADPGIGLRYLVSG